MAICGKIATSIKMFWKSMYFLWVGTLFWVTFWVGTETGCQEFCFLSSAKQSLCAMFWFLFEPFEPSVDSHHGIFSETKTMCMQNGNCYWLRKQNVSKIALLCVPNLTKAAKDPRWKEPPVKSIVSRYKFLCQNFLQKTWLMEGKILAVRDSHMKWFFFFFFLLQMAPDLKAQWPVQHRIHKTPM